MFVVGFSELSQDYKIALIKSHAFKVWLCRIACMFDEKTHELTLETSIHVTKWQLESIYGVSETIETKTKQKKLYIKQKILSSYRTT